MAGVNDSRLNSCTSWHNPTILQNIDTMDDIQHKLQQAIMGLKRHGQDATTCHAMSPGGNKIPSPLSLQDEQILLPPTVPYIVPKYSVTLVMGSPALGLTIEAMRVAFNASNEFQPDPLMPRYEVQVMVDSAQIEFSKFTVRIQAAIDNSASEKPAALLISLEECSSIHRITCLILIAYGKASKATRLQHPLRIVFLLDPKAMWSWHSNPQVIAPHVGRVGEINLSRWPPEFDS